MPDFTLKPLPRRFGRDYCERYRIEARKRLRPSGAGRHLQLYRGQSLEFRDFTEYYRGNDIRLVDWRASARYRGPDDWLVRNFVAEEAFKLVISIDTRESLFYPHGQEKLQQAAWLSELLGRIALYAGDHVYLHRLFGIPAPPRLFERPHNQARLFPWLRQNTQRPAAEQLNLASLREVIYPVAAWVVVSDFYWEAESSIASNLAHFIREVDEGWRWVILVNLNSWPYERSLLASGQADFAWKINGPGLAYHERVEIDDPNLLQKVEDNIKAAQISFCKQAHRDKFDSTWDWTPISAETQLDPEVDFRRRFEQDSNLKLLFMKSS